MDLGDLARRAQELGGPSTSKLAGNAAGNRAHYLLAGSGVTPGNISKSFGTSSTGIETMRRADVPLKDNEVYIRGLQQKGREAMMQESMDRVNREFDAFLEETLQIDFDQQKKKIMAHFGLIPADPDAEQSENGRSKNVFADSAKNSTRSVFGRSAMQRSMIGNAGAGVSTASFFGDDSTSNGMNGAPANLMKGQTERSLHEREKQFIDKVKTLNRRRMQREHYPIIQEFAMVEGNQIGDSPKQIVNAYNALKEIANESPSVKERQYAQTYLYDHVNATKAVQLKKQILDGSRQYLEASFWREIRHIVEKNPIDAQLGGKPDVLAYVRAYVRVRAARRDLGPENIKLQQIGENGDYCWTLIFYLLRCGYVKEAVRYVAENPAFQSTDKRFISYLTHFEKSPDRKLNRKFQDMINGEYQQRARIAPEDSVDPYRMACYKVVGRCDLTRRNLDVVGQGVDDWIWLQFCLAREFTNFEELSGEVFGLDQIVETVQEIGDKHFAKGQDQASGGYGTFFFMQVLAGMFEPAVAYLHSHNPVSAVHFAIALTYYGLLRCSDSQTAGNELSKLLQDVAKHGLTFSSDLLDHTESTNQLRALDSILHRNVPNSSASGRRGLHLPHLPQLGPHACRTRTGSDGSMSRMSATVVPRDSRICQTAG